MVTSFDFSRRLLLILSLSGLILNVGCEQGQVVVDKVLQRDRTFHQKFGWKAEDFFEDAQVAALCKAIEANDLAEMERLIKQGADVNAIGKGNMTPLMWAFPDNKLPRFTKLLEHGANPNVQITSDLGIPSAFAKGDSVTTRAAQTRFLGYFEAVMKAGGDVSLRDGTLNMPLLHLIVLAMVPDAKERCKLVLDRGAKINEVHAGGTPTMDAIATAGQYDLAMFLLENGADPFVYREDQLQRLIHCVVSRESELARLQPWQRVMFKRVLDWLVAHGEDADAARADLKRWNQKFNTPGGFKSQFQIELAEKRRQQEEAARGEVPREKTADQEHEKRAPTDRDNSDAD